MYVFKRIEDEVVDSTITRNTQNLDQNYSSSGISFIDFQSASYEDSPTKTLKANGNHWEFLHNSFYLSGSADFSASDPYSYEEIPPPSNQIGWQNLLQYTYTQHRTKFYNTGSVLYIPQHYYGERIYPGTFKLTIQPHNIEIVDDGKGNIYSTNAENSQSAGHLSSSDNYIGNIFYDYGIATITETGSWSGSVNYTDLMGNYNISFDSYWTIHTRKWYVVVQPNEFNITLNQSARGIWSGSDDTWNYDSPSQGVFMDKQRTRNLAPRLTGSEFTPFASYIGLYGKDTSIAGPGPLVTAALSKPIQMDKDVPIIFEIRLDF